MDSKREDGELIQQILAGDGKQFSLLVNRYQRSIFSTAFGMLGNQQDAEDVTQEAFVTAFRKLESFEGRSSFLTWLRRIAFNLAIDLRRRQKSRASMTQIAVAEEIVSAQETSVADAMISKETVSTVRRAIDSLPDEQRIVIVLRDLQDLDYSEIAELLSIPIGTVRSRLHRARLELKATLERMGAAPLQTTAPLQCDAATSSERRKGEV
jgi:RNA polymerase sigma-70 factor (ECF subfamily)